MKELNKLLLIGGLFVMSFYACHNKSGTSLSEDSIRGNKVVKQNLVDEVIFSKKLELNGIGFAVELKNGEFTHTLRIVPSGLSIDNRAVTHEIDALVTDAEIADLNNDGFPEILVFTNSVGSGSYGNVIAYSVNNGKSISQVYFPPIHKHPEINNGYMGHDEFSVVENSLRQRFPTYAPGDVNAKPSGKTRVISYKMVDGEASRIFVVEEVNEYDRE